MLHSLPALFGAVATALVCLFAIIAGSWRERLGGILYVGAYNLSLLLMIAGLKAAVWRFLLVDGVCVVGFLCLCWKAAYPWPLWAFGAQLLSVLASLSALQLGAQKVMKWTLVTLVDGLGYVVLVALLMGTFVAVRARKRMRRGDGA